MPANPMLGPRRYEQIVTVTDASRQGIQRALDALRGPAVVVLPAARVTLDAPLDVKTDDLLVVGAGPDATVLVRGADEAEGIHPMLRARGKARVHVSGIGFEGASGAASQDKAIGVELTDAAEFRVDHCRFAHLGFAGVRTQGTSYGVVDHSTFVDQFKPAIGTDGYGVAVYGTDALADVPMGDADDAAHPRMFATFIEDSAFTGCRHAAASNKGGRYVFRHNRVTSGVVAHAVDAHGAEFGSTTGGEWIDVYDNVLEQPFHQPPYYDGWAVRIRGGRGLVHDNVITGYRVGVQLSQDTDSTTGPVYVWGNTLAPGGKAVEVTHKKGVPALVEGQLAGYREHAYPHPSAAAACGGAPTVSVGWAQICKR
jgi:hypothetical protein